MPNSVLTTAGLALFTDALHDGFAIPVDRIIFADVPELDPTVTPDPNQGLPDTAYIVLNAEVEFYGKVDDNTVVYSRILKATEGNYYINWIGLYSSEYDTLVAVCAVPRHQKFKTDGFQAGNTLYKNFALQFANAASLTGITIRPETWQYDFDTRYALKSHVHDDRYEPLGAVNTHNGAANPHPGKFEVAGAAETVVNTHNEAANPHPGKFEAAGAVNTHNESANPHPGKFEASGAAETAVNAHNSAATPHPGKFEAAGAAATAVNTHNESANPHPGKFEVAGAAETAVNTHNESANPHPGKFEASGAAETAVNTHNGAASPHPGKFEASGAVNEHNQDLEAHGGIVNNKANKNFDNLTLETALANLGFVGSLSQNGYQKLPGGLIVQWGLSLYDDGSLTSRSVVFPITYPNEALVVFGCDIGTLSYHYSFASLSTTGFDAHFAAGTGAWGFNWISVGY